MVLRLKAWESRSPPGQMNERKNHTQDPKTDKYVTSNHIPNFKTNNAGWSSPVARQAHNLKVVGSNPTPATKYARNSMSYGLFDSGANYLSFPWKHCGSKGARGSAYQFKPNLQGRLGLPPRLVPLPSLA